MSKWRFLDLYRASLQLYPKDFRDAFAEEMFFIAEDSLRDARTKAERTRVMRRLVLDFVFTLIRENSNHIGDAMKKQKQTVTKASALSALILGLQISAVAFAVFIYTLIATNVLSYRPDPEVLPAWQGLFFFITNSVPLVIPVLALIILHKAARLSRWSKVVWTCGIGLTGVFGFIAFSDIENVLEQSYFPQLTSSGVWLQTYSFGHYLAVELVYLFAFYFIVSKFAKRFDSDRSARVQTK